MGKLDAAQYITYIPGSLLGVAEDVVSRLDQLELLGSFLCIFQIFICHLEQTIQKILLAYCVISILKIRTASILPKTVRFAE